MNQGSLPDWTSEEYEKYIGEEVAGMGEGDEPVYRSEPVYDPITDEEGK